VCVFWQLRKRRVSGCDSKIFSLSVEQGALLLIDGPFSSSQLPLKFVWAESARLQEKIKNTVRWQEWEKAKGGSPRFHFFLSALCAFRPAMLCERRRACVLYNLRQRAPAAVDLWIINRVPLARLLIKREEMFELFVLLCYRGLFKVLLFWKTS